MGSSYPAISRRAFLGLPAVAIVSALCGCTSDPTVSAIPANPDSPRSVEEIRASGTLRVGICSDAKPLSYLGSKGSYVGIDGYLCTYLPNKIYVGVDCVAVDPHERYDALATGEVDVCLVGMSSADERSDEALYTRPLYRLQLGLASSAAQPIESIDQLAGRELIVCEGSYAAQYAQDQWPELTLRPYQTLSDAFVALADGQGPALLGDEIVLASWLKDKPGFALSMAAIGEPRLVAAAVAAGQEELQALMDDGVSGYISGGYSRTAYDKYVKSSVNSDYSAMLCNNDTQA